ncbi:MAG TPA: peptidoglycan-associated lipoprotein Pal [Caldimonas sp.]|nr:peptidoglycan-associated lipoprotein Pal [Caldimonas sp.]
MTSARSTLRLAALAAALALAGCSSTKLDTPPPVEDRSQGGAGAAGATDANAGRAGQSGVTSVDLTKNNSMADDGGSNVVYFDFDSFVVKDEFRPVVEANARRLTSDRKRHLTVEGHTDERGSSEYNLALGQKRAEAVAKSMQLLGANESQIESVSFGKERPAVEGHDEAAWAKNRRAEIVAR